MDKIIEGEVNTSPFYLFTIRDLQIANFSHNVQDIKQIHYFLFTFLNKDFHFMIYEIFIIKRKNNENKRGIQICCI